VISLFLALFWLVTALAIFAFEWFNPERRLTIFDTGISAGWFALVLFAYNIIRWRSLRALQGGQRDSSRPPTAHRQEPPKPKPNPDFDFSDRPEQRNS
jgi:hypothetical protein